MRRLRWHAWVCLAVGLASGALVGAVRSAWGPAYRDSTARTLSQDLFERGITAPPQASFRVRALVVHPPEPDGVCWVTGTYSERGARGTREGPFKFRASRPYVPRLAVSSAEPGGLTVASYLNELAVRVPQARLGYRYAWWERPGGAVALWTSTGALVGAVVGFLRRRNGAFVERCAEAGPAIASCDPAPEPCPEPVVAPQLAPRKAFGGEFYPTEIHPDPCHTPE